MMIEGRRDAGNGRIATLNRGVLVSYSSVCNI